MQDAAITDGALQAFDELCHELGIFMDSVATWFQTNPRLARGSLPVVHSVKKRIKDREHLREKINRKSSPERIIDAASLPLEVTDLTGVRVLHIHQDQFRLIHAEILNKVNIRKDWHLHEQPRAYTWDQESNDFFRTLDLHVVFKPSSYTSVHYVVRPKPDSNICCEIQVRTLFEEVWGEVDHVLNYPSETSIIACREQLRVLAKIAGAGTRLVDSIFRSMPAVPTEPVPSNPEARVVEIARGNQISSEASVSSELPAAPVQVMLTSTNNLAWPFPDALEPEVLAPECAASAKANLMEIAVRTATGVSGDVPVEADDSQVE